MIFLCDDLIKKSCKTSWWVHTNKKRRKEKIELFFFTSTFSLKSISLERQKLSANQFHWILRIFSLCFLSPPHLINSRLIGRILQLFYGSETILTLVLVRPHAIEVWGNRRYWMFLDLFEWLFAVENLTKPRKYICIVSEFTTSVCKATFNKHSTENSRAKTDKGSKYFL